jgi:chromate reductase, NAD(P)H dehydrogenase (quinone)
MSHYRVGYMIGSLSSTSINRLLSKALIQLAPPELAFTEISFRELPLYTPDFDADFPPPAVAFKRAIAEVDAVLFITPEYNRSIPGGLKNAIDWASRPPSDIPHVFGDLPVALVGAGGLSGTRNAQTAWVAVFRYLKMRPWFGHSLFVDRSRERFDQDNRLTDEGTREQLRAVVGGFADYCAQLPRARAS